MHSANGQAVKRGTSLKYSLQPFIYMYNTQGHTSEFLLHCTLERHVELTVWFSFYQYIFSVLVLHVTILFVISILFYLCGYSM